MRVINKQQVNVDTDDESVGSTTSVLSVSYSNVIIESIGILPLDTI